MKRFGWISCFLLGLGLVGGLAAPGSGESPTGESLVQLREIAVEPRDKGVAVQIKTSGPIAYQTSLIDTPTRLVIDLESTGYGWRKTLLTVDMDPLRQIRGSQFRKGVSRVVLELTRKVGYRVEEGPDGLTVTLEPLATPAAPTKADGKSAVETKPTEVVKVEPPAQEAKPEDTKPSPQAATLEPKAPEPMAEAPKAEPPKPVASAPKQKLARQPVVAAVAPTPVPTPPSPVRLAQAPQIPPIPNGSRLISLDFKDADIANVLRILAAESGKNIVAGEDVKGKVSISLHNVPWEQALETVLEAKGLQKLEKGNVLRIVSTEQLTKEREAKAKAEEAKVKGEAEARTKLAEAQLKEAEAQQKKLVAEAAIAEAQARGPLREETIRLNYADPEEVAKTLQGILGIPERGAPAVAPPITQPGVTPSIGMGGPPPIAEPPFSALYGPQAGAPAGAAAVGTASAEVLTKGLTIRAHKATNTIFLRLYEKDLERVKKLIRETLDVPLPQVKIEARLEELNRTALLEIGVQWGGAGAIRDGRNILVGQGFTVPSDLTRTAGIPQIPGSLGFPGKVNPAANLLNLLPVAAATGLPTGGNLVNLPFTGGSTGLAPAGGINFGIIGTRFNLNLALQALENMQKTRTLARPEIVTVENKPAQMSLGEEIPYATVSSAGTQVQFKEAVLSLTVTPTVIREGDITKIKMKVVVENNSRGFTATSGPAAGIPAINKRRAETEVVVKEGEVLVIGGVSQRAASEGENKVPLLGDIPILGWLFKKKTTEINPDRELVVFIAPSIVKGGSPYPFYKPLADKP
jgi:type IV pilus assembly protein PilQ